MTREQVPHAVLRAFGVAGEPQPLVGGQDTSWLCDGVVLKPGGGRVHEWLAEALVDVACVGFRLAQPIRTVDGQWSAQGWTGTSWVTGGETDFADELSLLRIIDAGRAFHRAVADVERSVVLDGRDDHWAVADRIAWDEIDHEFCPELADTARRLRHVVEPLGRPQLVHGDLTGNVLLSPEHLPAVIDVSPYWRPAGYAEAIVVADALCWHHAQPSLAERAGVSVPAIARALLFRLATTDLGASSGAAQLTSEARRYERATHSLGL